MESERDVRGESQHFASNY